MTTKLQKWGNSLGVRLPKTEVKKAGLREGKLVSVTAIRSGIFIKATPTKREKLNDLVEKITPTNRYAEFDWGESVGNEIW